MADLVELVRAPAALTVPGDVLAGGSSAGWPAGRRTWLLPVASTALYWGGMALNDFSDRAVDAVERPERPVPSGRVSAGRALAVAGGLTAAGLAVAAAGGGLRVAAPLAASAWAYDLLLKDTPAGPFAMAAARGLDVALGASGRPGAALVPAAAVALHTVGVTVLSRGEVHGAPRSSAGLALAATSVAALAAAVPRGWLVRPAAPVLTGAPAGPPARVLPGLVAAGLGAAYALTVGRAQAAAYRSPDAGTVRRATGSGVRGVIPLQGALTAGAGSPLAGLGLVLAAPLARAASRVVSPT
ncbi:SCO3242 family prenyltransferase [Aquipuribacter hungaricus]|uniref:SCO3242 family prenyltransferase n=1 Tax=Aquipuribacter hungaricus TaxID=545624 RepID=UPI0036118FC4